MTFNNRVTLKLQGEWRDTYLFSDGTKKETEWKSNQIQNRAADVLAQLIAFSRTTGNSPTNGFAYLAVGEGNASWDITPPIKDPDQEDLTNEVDRIPIETSTDIVYLDPVTEAISVSPTRLLQVSVLIDFNRGIGDLREFGLVVENATATTDSGFLFNWIDHTLITKQIAPNPFQILRVVRIRFLLPSEC